MRKAQKAMRIGIDARFIGPGGTGIGRYTQELIQNLEKIDPSTDSTSLPQASTGRGGSTRSTPLSGAQGRAQASRARNEYVIFLRKDNFDLYQPKAPNFRKVLADVLWYSLKEQLVLPFIFRRERLDILHVPHFNIPLLYPGKLVVTIHDLTKSEWGGHAATTRAYPIYWIKHLGYRLAIFSAIRKAAAVIVPSEYIKKKVVAAFHLDPKKVTFTYEAGTLVGKERTTGEKEAQDILSRFGITKPYFLYAGTAYPYKNIPRLISAIVKLNSRINPNVASLVIVGARDVFKERLEREIVARGAMKYVVLTGYITDADLIDLYKEAIAYVQPSLSEGFGLGPVEAMSLGTPVVEANASCLPEIAGDAALYFDPFDPDDIADKLERILGDKALRRRLVKKGLARVKQFSWERMARETLGVYRSILK